MKHTVYRMVAVLALCALPVAFFSCTRDIVEGPYAGRTINFSASIAGDMATRTAFSGQGATDQQTGSLTSERIDWVEGDLITILSPQAKVKVGNQLVYSSDNPQYSTADYSVKTPSTEGETVSRATIEPVSGSGLQWGEGQHNFYALYPSSATITPTGFTATIPYEQTPQWSGNTGSAQMQYAYMTAPASAPAGAAQVSLPFSAQFTAFEFTVGAGVFSSVSLTSFTLEALDANAAVAGDFSYNFSDGTVTPGSNTSNKITVDLTGKSVTSAQSGAVAQSLTFTVLGLPMDMGAMRMTFTGDEIGERTLILKNKSGEEITFNARNKYRIGGIAFPLTGGGEDIIWDQEGFGEDILWDDQYLLEGTFASSLNAPYTGGDITLATDFRSCMEDGSYSEPVPFEFQHSADNVNWTSGLPDWLSPAAGTSTEGYTTATTLSLTVSAMEEDASSRSVYLRIFQPASGNISSSCEITQQSFSFGIPLTIEPKDGEATVTISNPNRATIKWSIDGVEQSDSNTKLQIAVPAGKCVALYQDDRSKSVGTISLSAPCYVYGNVMSLVAGTDFMSQTEMGCDYQFYGLFADYKSNLCNHDSKDIVLPATTLTAYCYYEMFAGTSLTSLPKLPAKTLATGCYCDMFSGCTSLITVPADYLPAKTLAESCYSRMFAYCTSLTTVPDLPAKTLADYCYCQMFEECISLTTLPDNYLHAENLAEGCYSSMFTYTSLNSLPKLPAKTLAKNCYRSMFMTCKSLNSVPIDYLQVETLAEGCYESMFWGCSELTSLPELPADTLAKRCYSGMFQYCAALTTVPVNYLKAKTLAEGCYQTMFSYCTELTTVPTLPAENLAKDCYWGMFHSCALTTLPDKYLHAENLAEGCYCMMFAYCANLTQAPDLPATTLAESCYNGMFSGCTGLTKAPILLAPTLVNNCYHGMFYGCKNLDYVECHATRISAHYATLNWMAGVAPNGTFKKKAGVSWLSGGDGIPSGWTVEEL